MFTKNSRRCLKNNSASTLLTFDKVLPNMSTRLGEVIVRGLEKLSPEHQECAKRQIRSIIESLAAMENPDTNYE